MDSRNGEQASDIELLEAQAHIWNHMFSFINSMSLKCAIELGIPDTIHKHGKPMTLLELVAALSIHPTKASHVPRLMRILSYTGFFVQQKIDHDDQQGLGSRIQGDDQQGYVLTLSSRLLLGDNPFDVSPILHLAFDPLMIKPSQCMSTWFRNKDPTVFDTAHGIPIWDCARREPEFGRLFDEAMASDARLVVSVVINKCREVFEGVKSLVDVGGGTGTMAKGLANAFPDLECTVLDLPHVVDGLQGTKNVKFLGGDMFDTIPSTNVILLKWVLHNLGDEDCVKILKKCKEAIVPSGTKRGKVVIVDMVVGHRTRDHESTETQLLFDMQMMTLVTGKERKEKEWAELFTNADFSHYKINPILGLRSLIEVYP